MELAEGILRTPHGETISRSRPEFVSALSLRGLISGVPVVDSLIGGLKSDTMTFLTGSGVRLRAAEGYCVRAQLPESRGGLHGGAFFIDGGNSFDIYLFTNMVRKNHLNYDAALELQLVSRVFTIYELRQLVEDAENVFAARKPKLLVVSEVLSLFTEDIEKAEARSVFRDIVSALSELGRREQVPVLITSVDRPPLLAPILEEDCSVSAEVMEEDRMTCTRLFKHPWKPATEMVLRMPEPRNYNQDALLQEAGTHG